jgi:superfamily II DNA/RNA helicase
MSETTFGTLGVPAPLVAVLTAQDKTTPFPIQADTLPDTLAGRDVLGRGKTGSGKTLAFAIPMVARLGGTLAGGQRRAGRPLGLVLAPTRELATQISATIIPLAEAYGLKVTTIFGGVSQQRQVAALKAGVDIVVACPGRLEDLMQQRFVTLDAVEITVLDEADHMADLGFLPVVTRILDKTPNTGQRLLFSATLDNGVDKIVKRFLHNEVHHSVDDVNSHVEAMTHHVFEVDSLEAKKQLVQTLASGKGRRILFTRTKHHAKKLAKQLTDAGIPAVDLHGNLSQAQRDRNLATFAAGDALVMVATDVAARGIDIDHIELVVHVDPPAEHKAYLPRSGRTARAGSSGDVAVIVLPTQRRETASMLRKAGIAAVPETVTAASSSVAALVGEVAAYVKPAPKTSTQAASASHGTARSRSRSGRARDSSGHLGDGGVRDDHSRGDRQGRRRQPQDEHGQQRGAQHPGANRDEGSRAARHGRSGRPGASPDPVRAHQQAGRNGQRNASHPPRQAREGARRAFSTSTPVRGERRTGRRAQG